MSLGWALISRAEDFVRRHWKTKAVRDAEKRQRDRRRQLAARRARRGLSMGLISGAGIAGYSLAVAPLAGPALAAAGAAALLAVAAGAAWPARRNASGTLSNDELVQLACDGEEWLLARRAGLPHPALTAVDAILVHLGDLQPHLGRIDPRASLAWDARRLIGDHLPRFVDAWCDLPTATRDEDPELAGRLTEALETLEDELARLCRDISRSRLVDFEARGRFIESRYRDSESLRSD
jgi:hypothetical protein